jgi:hypothetical protein
VIAKNVLRRLATEVFRRKAEKGPHGSMPASGRKQPIEAVEEGGQLAAAILWKLLDWNSKCDEVAARLFLVREKMPVRHVEVGP